MGLAMSEQDDNKPSGNEPPSSDQPFNPEVPPADAPSRAPATEAAAPAGAPQAEPAASSATAPEPKIEPSVPPAATVAPPPQRRSLRAASIVLAAGLGAAVAAYATASWISPPPARPDVASIEERKALQQSIAQLSKQVATLKADLDKSNTLAQDRINKLAADVATKPAAGTVIKTADRADINKSTDISSGPVAAPAAPSAARLAAASAIAAPAGAPATGTVRMPAPRPAPRIAAVPSRPVILQDWWIYGARGGYIYVAGHGEVFQVMPGAPLPGLGLVQSIRREDGGWVVVTPKGLIVADRRRFD